jgi:hypothetical protein
MKKQIAVWIICLSLSFIVPNRSLAFEYDVWKSGMTLDDVLKLAEINDIPVTCRKFNKPLQRGRDHFRTEVLKQAKKARNLIRWTDAEMTQQKELILELAQKYGEPLKYNPQKDAILSTPDIQLEYGVSETQFFIPDKHNIIVVQYTKEAKNVLRIIYSSKSLLKQEQTELTAFEQYIKTRYRQQDENRL